MEPNFGSNTLQATIGKSNYNALQIGLRHVSGPLQLSAQYTFSKSMDESSNVGEEVNPINPSLSYAISSFDVKHNFVASYSYDLPVASLFGATNRWTEGWSVSGITHISSGLPVTLYNNTDNSLLGTIPNGINDNGVDTLNVDPGNLAINTNPSKGPAFNTALFSIPALGQMGNAPRWFFYGPGLENFDLALRKTVERLSSKFHRVGFEELQQSAVPLAKAGDSVTGHRSPLRSEGADLSSVVVQGFLGLGCFRGTNVAFAQLLDQFLFECRRHSVFQPLGFFMNLVPGHAENL